jgi:hypothetical protein
MNRLRSRALLLPLLIAPAILPMPSTSAAASKLSSAIIEQIGNGNRTLVTQIGGPAAGNSSSVWIRGNDNGTRVITGGRFGLRLFGSARGKAHANDGTDDAHGGHASHGNGNGYGHTRGGIAADLVVPQLASGIIHQEGRKNVAVVRIEGHRNDFHVTQVGENNTAIQAIHGEGNAAAMLQGRALILGNNNFALQAQTGIGNWAHVAQSGDNNVSRQVQAGSGAGGQALAIANTFGASPEAMLTSLSSMAGGNGNRSLLEQNGNNNNALLVQAGNNNMIALRQPGDATASITQLGNGHAIMIEQSRGTSGAASIQICQGCSGAR